MTKQQFIDEVVQMAEDVNRGVMVMGGIAAMEALRDEAIKKHNDLPFVHIDWDRVAKWLSETIDNTLQNVE